MLSAMKSAPEVISSDLSPNPNVTPMLVTLASFAPSMSKYRSPIITALLFSMPRVLTARSTSAVLLSGALSLSGADMKSKRSERFRCFKISTIKNYTINTI